MSVNHPPSGLAAPDGTATRQPKVERPELVIFDCDGVLVDSEPLAAPILARAMRELGLDAAPEDVDRDMRGRSLRDCVVEIEARLGRPVPTTFLPALEARTREVFERELQPIPGVAKLLEALVRARIPCAVASSGSHEKIRTSLKLTGLAAHFGDRIFSASDVERGKPAPDLFLHAAARLGVAESAALVIEDSGPGVRAGVAAGMRVFHYCPDCESASPLAGVTLARAMSEVAALLGLE